MNSVLTLSAYANKWKGLFTVYTVNPIEVSLGQVSMSGVGETDVMSYF